MQPIACALWNTLEALSFTCMSMPSLCDSKDLLAAERGVESKSFYFLASRSVMASKIKGISGTNIKASMAPEKMKAPPVIHTFSLSPKSFEGP